jgi:hypothetical protein
MSLEPPAAATLRETSLRETRARRWLDYGVDALGGLLLFLALIALPHPPSPDLDPSWMAVLAYAAEKNLQFGRDIVFTYGPLGHLTTIVWGGDHSGWRFASELIFKSAIAVVLVAALRPLRLWHRVAVIAAFAILLPISPDALFSVALIAVLAVGLRQANPLRPASLLICAGLGIVALTKFTLLLGGFVVIVALSLKAVAGIHRRLSLVPLVAFATSFALVWVLCSQRLTGLPDYLVNSLEVSRGYGLTMGLSGTTVGLVCGVTLFAGVALLASATALLDKAPWLEKLGQLGAIGAIGFLSWKHGFVRADALHVVSFFLVAGSVAAAWPVWTTSLRTRSRHLLAGGSLLLVGVALLGIRLEWPGLLVHQTIQLPSRLKENLAALSNPAAAIAALNRGVAEAREQHRLPEMATAAGAAPVDVFGIQQSYALLNNLNYVPRPSIQSYPAYTRRLAKLNERSYLAASPEFVLFRLEPIDGRIPALEDPLTLALLLRHYRAVGSAGPSLILQQSNAVSPIEPQLQPLGSLTAKLGEAVPLPDTGDDGLWIRIHAQLNLWGKLRSFALRPPRVRAALGFFTGEPQPFRAPLPMLEGGFLIRPFFANQFDALDYFTGGGSSDPSSIALLSNRAEAWLFKREVRYEFSLLPLPVPPSTPATSELRQGSLWNLRPLGIDSPFAAEEVLVEGMPLLQVHAPGSIVFRLPANAQRLSGLYGLRPEAYAEAGRSDGVLFQVLLADGEAEPIVLWERFLDPSGASADRGLHRFEVELPPGSPRRLLLQTTPGPAGDLAWDWSAWGDLRFVFADAP